MSESELKPTMLDHAHMLTKAGLSAIPFLGGPAAELFSTLIIPPLTKRRDQWLNDLACGLTELEQKVNGFSLQELSNNEVFISTVMQASQVAIRNHQAEKLQALKNTVLNTALSPNIDDEIISTFPSIIDIFTSWHLKVLKFFDDPQKALKPTSRQVLMTSPYSILESTYPELATERDFCRQIITDLNMRGLLGLDSSSLHTTMTAQGAMSPRTTALGKMFIKFILLPLI